MNFFCFQKNAPFKAIYIIGCSLQLMLVPLRLASINYLQDQDTLQTLQMGEETILILSLPSSWAMVLFFTKVTMMVGPLVNIVLVYIRKDLLPFLVILIIAFIAFATAFFHMWKGIDQEGNETFKTLTGTLMRLFHVTLGEFEYEEFYLTRAPAMAIGVFVIFMILMPILLLNMLIAMMATTFERVIKKSEKDWIHEWAKITITLERTFSPDELLEYQKVYSVEIDNGQFKDYRGLMVIRTTSKTKAKQRRDALKHWKRAKYEVMGRIREFKEFCLVGGHKLYIDFKTLFPDPVDDMMEDEVETAESALRLWKQRGSLS